jgi:hypothetical protein
MLLELVLVEDGVPECPASPLRALWRLRSGHRATPQGEIVSALGEREARRAGT